MSGNGGVAAWELGNGKRVALDRPRLMVVLNVTPDSFSDGGELSSRGAVVDRALRFVDEGADVLDIGGESTRPGARRVGEAEQIRRVVPAVEAVRAAGIGVAVSVDTTLEGVAAAALDAGADAINDVSGGEESDWGVARLAAERGCGLVLMHRLRDPASDVYSHEYRAEPSYGVASGGAGVPGVVSAVGSALEAKTARARDLGVAAGRICVDPGLGFGKSVAQNLALMGHAGWFCERFGRAGSGVLWGASRKSFVGAVTGVEAPADRVLGSVGVACAVACGGGRLFRVHDVRAHREALAAAFGVSRMAWAGGVA